jgi:hypothetical protein
MLLSADYGFLMTAMLVIELKMTDAKVTTIIIS